jgi:hypothetical protein
MSLTCIHRLASLNGEMKADTLIIVVVITVVALISRGEGDGMDVVCSLQ